MRRSILTVVLVTLPVVAGAQIPPAATLVPPGFKVVTERALGPTTVIEAAKPNEDVPKPHQDNGILLAINWIAMPGAERTVEMMAAQPEEPAQRLPGSVSRGEPCGKKRYRGGVLTCRKTITPWVGAGNGPDLVTLDVTWLGALPKGQLSINVRGFVGAIEAAVALIDGVIAKIIPAHQ